MVWLRRMGWGAAGIMLLLLAAFASLVRVTINPPDAATGQRAAMPAAQNQIDPATLIIPVAGVTSRQLTDTWGQSRGGGTREHHAIDIMAPRGTPVLAAASGIVEKIFESANGGHTIYIRTADRSVVHYYAHLDAYAVSEGQKVTQGQQIATVGNTGSAAGGAPHLHFEIKTMQPTEGWWQGVNVNPYPLLAFGPGRGE
ncbi:M23 family metallopeptidase [Sphingomonas soli]|uniref:M23 family metallopeptidase n=1 Tax=Sphingomonas soli TaxID=266127 RepID=UPI00082E2D2D|nr:M23 family metallopeptidase [Sphingomonas soli]